MPVRVQLKRTKGWKMPDNTVKVDRSTKWGNPWRVVRVGRFACDNAPAWAGRHEQEVNYPLVRTHEEAAQRATQQFRSAMVLTDPNLTPLRGKNLACWCKLGSPCHADVLLDLANPGPSQ